METIPIQNPNSRHLPHRIHSKPTKHHHCCIHGYSQKWRIQQTKRSRQRRHCASGRRSCFKDYLILWLARPTTQRKWKNMHSDHTPNKELQNKRWTNSPPKSITTRSLPMVATSRRTSTRKSQSRTPSVSPILCHEILRIFQNKIQRSKDSPNTTSRHTIPNWRRNHSTQ